MTKNRCSALLIAVVILVSGILAPAAPAEAAVRGVDVEIGWVDRFASIERSLASFLSDVRAKFGSFLNRDSASLVSGG